MVLAPIDRGYCGAVDDRGWPKLNYHRLGRKPIGQIHSEYGNPWWAPTMRKTDASHLAAVISRLQKNTRTEQTAGARNENHRTSSVKGGRSGEEILFKRRRSPGRVSAKRGH